MFRSKNRKRQELEDLVETVDKEECAERLRQWFANSQKKTPSRKVTVEINNLPKE